MDAYLDILKQREIRPTAIRLLILKAMMRFEWGIIYEFTS